MFKLMLVLYGEGGYGYIIAMVAVRQKLNKNMVILIF